MKEYPWGKGTPMYVRTTSTNDSDVTYTVPTGKVWVLEYVLCQLTATATVGNRVLTAAIGNGSANVWVSRAGGAITASNVGGLEVLFNGAPTTTTTKRDITNGINYSTFIQDNGPSLILPAGYTVRVYDVAAVDAAADDMIIVLHYVEYDA